MSLPRKHHYIPQMYLRRFANPKGQIKAFRRVAQRSFTTNITDAAAERDFYMLSDESGALNPEVEHLLSQIEGETASILAEIQHGKFPPTGDERETFATFLGLLLTRTREMRHVAEEQFDYLMKLLVEDMTREEIRARLRDNDDHEPTEAEIDEAEEMVKNLDQYRIGTDQNATIALMLKVAVGSLAPIIYDMRWHLVEGDERGFVTGDHPIVYWRVPKPENAYMGVGLKTADEVYLPLDPYRALVMTHKDRGYPERIQANKETFRGINALLVGSAYEWVFHHPKHDPLEGVAIPKHRPLFYADQTPIYRGEKELPPDVQGREGEVSGFGDIFPLGVQAVA